LSCSAACTRPQSSPTVRGTAWLTHKAQPLTRTRARTHARTRHDTCTYTCGVPRVLNASDGSALGVTLVLLQVCRCSTLTAQHEPFGHSSSPPQSSTLSSPCRCRSPSWPPSPRRPTIPSRTTRRPGMEGGSSRTSSSTPSSLSTSSSASGPASCAHAARSHTAHTLPHALPPVPALCATRSRVTPCVLALYTRPPRPPFANQGTCS
jgi:hypothetical protein